MGRGVVSSRVTLLLRSAEIKPYWSQRSPLFFSPHFYFLSTSGYVVTLRLKRMPPPLSGLKVKKPTRVPSSATATRLCFQRTKNHQWILYPSPVIRLCCQCKSWGGFQYFVKVPSSGYVASASHGVGFNILSKSRHPVMLPVQVMGGFNILSKSHHPVMLPVQIMGWVSIFCQSPIIRLCCQSKS